MQKGALELLSPDRALRRRVEFPLNPEQLVRRQLASPEGGVSETIELRLLLHAMAGDPPATPETGIYPQLAAFEELLQLQEQQPGPGVVPRFAGRPSWASVVLHWGGRKVPVVIERLHVTETLFSDTLAPLQANLELLLRLPTAGELRERPEALALLDAYRAQRAAAAGSAG